MVGDAFPFVGSSMPATSSQAVRKHDFCGDSIGVTRGSGLA
jgi:hypothetical protein